MTSIYAILGTFPNLMRPHVGNVPQRCGGIYYSDRKIYNLVTLCLYKLRD